MLLDWLLAHGVECLPDVASAELCVLGRLTDENHPALDQVKFSKPVYAAVAHALLPTRFSDVGWARNALGYTDEAAWAWSVIKDLPRPPIPYARRLSTDYLVHRIFWATDFGVLQVPARPDAVEALWAAWSMVKIPDDAAKIAMALHMMAESIDPQDVESKIAQGDPATHDDYHPHLTADCWRALVSV